MSRVAEVNGLVVSASVISDVVSEMTVVSALGSVVITVSKAVLILAKNWYHICELLLFDLSCGFLLLSR